MGYPMAAYLARNGHDLVVFNRTAAKASSWCNEYGGQSAATPAEAAETAEIVFSCVGNDDDVREVLLGETGVMTSIAGGAMIVDHTTASATVARDVAAVAHAKSVGFLDAPVSGGQAGAENGQLTVMVGGATDDFERAAPVMDCYAKAITHIGPVGSGQLAKMVNQICIAGVVQGLAEGLDFEELVINQLQQMSHAETATVKVNPRQKALELIAESLKRYPNDPKKAEKWWREKTKKSRASFYRYMGKYRGTQ